MDNQQIHILVVDDSKDDREMYAQFLSSKGYRTTLVDNGRDGLEKAFELRPDVILTDLRLPGVDGWEGVQVLKSDPRTKDCPVIVITGLTWLKPQMLESDGWLTKPCSLEKLDAEITRVLKPRA